MSDRSFQQDSGRSYQDEQAESLLNEGIAAIMAGNASQAKQLLEKASGLRPGDGRAWLWLSATTEDPQEQRTYLEHALAADPGNGTAARGLMMLSDEKAFFATEHPSAPTDEQHLAQAETFQCSQCGGHLQFNVHQQEVTCQFCGHVQQTAKLLAADASEQSIHKALLTQKGHIWADKHQNLACENCGAVSLIPAGVTSDRCPYCGSNRMVRVAQAKDLVDPSLIALLKVDKDKAYERLRIWLSKGGLTPGKLVSHAERIHLQATYFPFWTFDGMLELSWRAEVNEGTNNNPHWVSVTGVETEVFDDIIIPGIKAQSRSELKKIEPFNLKDLVAFEPSYLAGWPALTYDFPLSKASLQARETVMRRIRTGLHSRVAGGREMRHLDHGAPNWHGMMFKLVLLPLWVGTYNYQGKKHRVLINGQTGKVSGARPRNYLKLLWVALIAILVAILLLILLTGSLVFLS